MSMPFINMIEKVVRFFCLSTHLVLLWPLQYCYYSYPWRVLGVLFVRGVVELGLLFELYSVVKCCTVLYIVGLVMHGGEFWQGRAKRGATAVGGEIAQREWDVGGILRFTDLFVLPSDTTYGRFVLDGRDGTLMPSRKVRRQLAELW